VTHFWPCLLPMMAMKRRMIFDYYYYYYDDDDDDDDDDEQRQDVSNSFGDFLRALCSSDVDTIVDKLVEFNVSKVTIDREALREKIGQITEHWQVRRAAKSAAAGWW
jgi:hypothetical protein